MNELIYEKEMECDFLALEYAISMIPLSNTDTFMEDGDSNIFTKIKDKIKEIVDKFKEWINNFFNKSDTKKEKEIEETIEKNPKLKNKKVKIKDYDKLSKLEQETISDLERARSPEDVDKKMASYKKKRAAILAATVTVSLGALLAYKKTVKNKRTEEVESSRKKIANTIDKFKLTCINIKNKMNKAKKPDASGKMVQASVKTDTIKIDDDQEIKIKITKAQSSIMKDQTDDAIKELNMMRESIYQSYIDGFERGEDPELRRILPATYKRAEAHGYKHADLIKKAYDEGKRNADYIYKK